MLTLWVRLKSRAGPSPSILTLLVWAAAIAANGQNPSAVTIGDVSVVLGMPKIEAIEKFAGKYKLTKVAITSEDSWIIETRSGTSMGMLSFTNGVLGKVQRTINEASGSEAAKVAVGLLQFLQSSSQGSKDRWQDARISRIAVQDIPNAKVGDEPHRMAFINLEISPWRYLSIILAEVEGVYQSVHINEIVEQEPTPVKQSPRR